MNPPHRDETTAWLLRLRQRCSIFLFAWASLGAVTTGALAMAAVHNPSAFWLRDVIAWCAGALLATGIVVSGFSRLFRKLVICGAFVGLGASLMNHGRMEVHRWVDAGPLHINVAALVLPALLVALVASSLAKELILGLTAGVMAILCLQPDPSQACGFAAAFLILHFAGGCRSLRQWLIVLLVVVAAGLSWIRPDSLPAVPEVEGIVQLAWHVSALLAVMGLGCLAVAAAAPLLLTLGDPKTARAGMALTTYFAVTAIAPSFGSFPVPLIGAGMSAIVGFWLGFGCLLRFHLDSSASRLALRVPANHVESHHLPRMDIGSAVKV